MLDVTSGGRPTQSSQGYEKLSTVPKYNLLVPFLFQRALRPGEFAGCYRVISISLID